MVPADGPGPKSARNGDGAGEPAGESAEGIGQKSPDKHPEELRRLCGLLDRRQRLGDTGMSRVGALGDLRIGVLAVALPEPGDACGEEVPRLGEPGAADRVVPGLPAGIAGFKERYGEDA